MKILRTLTSGTGWLLVGFVILSSLVFMLASSAKESAIMDELAHIPAGYGYVARLDHRLNPEHPPLVKALSAIPLLFKNVNFPTEHKAWLEDINGQWDMGTQLLYFSGNDADELLKKARLGPIFLMLLLIIYTYVLSRQVLGNIWGVLPALLVGLSPNFLAHGHYVTTDVAAALGTLVATMYFVRFLENPGRNSLWKAGLAFGFAQIAKFSTVLLFPFFGLLTVLQIFITVKERGGSRLRDLISGSKIYLGGMALILVIGYVLIVYPPYFLFTLNYPVEKQVADTSSILSSFSGGPTPAGSFCKPVRCLADLNIWMAGNPILRPFAEYALGILMVLQRSAGGNTNYFLGEVSASGWHYYFPVVYALKEPIPVLLIVLLGLLFAVVRVFRGGRESGLPIKERVLNYLKLNLMEFAMALFVVFYWAYSMKSPLNIGFRHLFPSIPFIYILAAISWKKWVRGEFNFGSIKEFFKSLVGASARQLLIICLGLWFVAESAGSYPYFLSYFNSFGGGTKYGYRYVTDSNYDWGQDLARLREFVKKHPEIDKIGVDYFGGGNPKYYVGEKEENWWSARGNPANEGIHWLALSVNTIQNATQKAVSGHERNPQDEYRWLTELRPPLPGLGNVSEPDYRVGTSIFVYKF